MDDHENDQRPVDYRPAMSYLPPAVDIRPESLVKIGHRFVFRSNPNQVLIYTDGACLNNGNNSAVGGCAFIFKSGEEGIVSFRLEDRGPSGELYTHTSNRAELRAVIAALQFRAWNGEGFNQLVIATDSEYVVKGATEWVNGWVRKGWRTSQGTGVKNKDLWESLFKRIQDFRENTRHGLNVSFWRIPREWNKVADRAAKLAASTEEAHDSFTKILGVLV